ncbi:MAG: acyltransferase [Anaerolineaceae bacterium]|nr:acyltransferase [Anaerolineaceae bacterium]
MSLTDYVQYRNGVPLGASSSLRSMLVHSLGAGTFAKFWQHWNPIWGYALGRFVYEPLNQFLPSSISLILTFIISGGIHDLATMLVRSAPAFFFTPWFFLMGIAVVFARLLKLDYSNQAFRVRVAINLTFILVCLMIAIGVKQLL